MSKNLDKPSRISVWGDGMLNKLPGTSRKQRKRLASKKRRQLSQRDLHRRTAE